MSLRRPRRRRAARRLAARATGSARRTPCRASTSKPQVDGSCRPEPTVARSSSCSGASRSRPEAREVEDLSASRRASMSGARASAPRRQLSDARFDAAQRIAAELALRICTACCARRDRSRSVRRTPAWRCTCGVTSGRSSRCSPTHSASATCGLACVRVGQAVSDVACLAARRRGRARGLARPELDARAQGRGAGDLAAGRYGGVLLELRAAGLRANARASSFAEFRVRTRVPPRRAARRLPRERRASRRWRSCAAGPHGEPGSAVAAPATPPRGDPAGRHRNTIARRFGSWTRRSRAAGLEDRRRRRPAPRQVGARGRRARAAARRSPARAGARDAPVRREPPRQPADGDAVLPLAARGGAGHADAGDRVSPLPWRLARRARGL